jgi:putative ABC transport system permease protein
MDGVIQLQIWQLAAAYIFIAIILFIVKARGIPREKEIIIATIRMTIQLALVGYILVWLFENPHPLWTILVIAVMLAFSIHNIVKRVKQKLSLELIKVIALAMSAGALISLLWFLLVVIGLTPWYEPRYFIPIAGMLVGNSMTGVALGVTKLVDGMETQREMVEAALMLGATPRVAAKPIVDGAFDAAILPTVNSMVGIGIVFLPGMMTGQILSGISPVTAIQYQLAVMLGIAGSVALTVIILVLLGYKTFFNQRQQLI